MDFDFTTFEHENFKLR